MTAAERTLVMISTYNEVENIEPMYRALADLGFDFDFLFIDDNSPDGTGRVIDRLAESMERVHALHRPKKLGVGGAHQEGIRWAYDHGYKYLLTLDGDFTHSPSRVAEFMAAREHCDVVVSSRFKRAGSLADWVWYRKLVTYSAHQLTHVFLGLPYDASGAFRMYNLQTIPREIFALAKDPGYSFFWESLHVIWMNGFTVREIPIDLPARVYGNSKMRPRDLMVGLQRLFLTVLRKLFLRRSLMLPARHGLQSSSGNRPNTKSEWDRYWLSKEDAKQEHGPGWYDVIARFYRIRIIRGALSHFIEKTFPPRARIIHAGCGGGEVDTDVVRMMSVTALDISDVALERYRQLHGDKTEIVSGSIFAIPAPETSYDGLYNLGVMEHFQADEIDRVMAEFNRVLKLRGRIVLFWPPTYGLSVQVIRVLHFVMNKVLKKNIRLHPDEPSLIQSRRKAEELLSRAGFRLIQYYFGVRDFFTYSVIVGEKIGNPLHGGSAATSLERSALQAQTAG